MVDLSLYLVTDRALVGDALLEVVRAAVRGGVTAVQLRQKDLDTRAFLAEAHALKRLLTPLGVPLIINDRVDIALACGAEGVHLGQSDMPVADARSLLPHAIIGLSVERMADVQANLPVDYLGVSPVFATPTKLDTKTPWGLDGLARLRASTRLPLVAIGGINAENAHSVREAGADGIAVVRAICAAPDPEAAARALAKR